MHKKTYFFLSALLLSTLSCTVTSQPMAKPRPQPKPQPSTSVSVSPTTAPIQTPTPSPIKQQPTPTEQQPTIPPPTPTPLPSASPLPYQVLSRYPSGLQDQSFIIRNADYTKAAVMSWVNGKTSVLYGIFPDQVRPIPISITAGVISSSQGRDHIRVLSQKENQQGLYILTAQTSNDFDFYAQKNSSFTRIINNEFQWYLPIKDYVAYGLSVNAKGNGWMMVSNEKKQTYPPLPNPPNKTLVGRIPVSQWKPAEGATLEPILELPLFFQHENVIKQIKINEQGNGLILVGSAKGKFNLHKVINFSAVASQELSIVPLSHENPLLVLNVLKQDTGHIDWRNGQFTRVKNGSLQEHLKLTADENRDYFLDASGNGYQIDRLPAAVHWQKIENYVPSNPEGSLRFTAGTRVDSITMNLSQSDRPLLMGMNYTCEEARDTCENKALTTREIWLKNLTESPTP